MLSSRTAKRALIAKSKDIGARIERLRTDLDAGEFAANRIHDLTRDSVDILSDTLTRGRGQEPTDACGH